jgi:hypothetical protein
VVRDAGLRVIQALLELAVHVLMVSALLLSIKLVEILVHELWGSQDYRFFDKLKLRYILDGSDLTLLVVFLSWSIFSVVGAYMRKK